MSILNQTH